jgi:hypothetical protein
MPDARQDAIELLKSSNISPEVVEALASHIENVPIDNSGQLDLPALEAKLKDHKLEVKSRRIRNITINWWDAVYKIGTRSGAIETGSAYTHHPDIGHLLEVLNGLNVLSGAMNVELGPKSAEVVRELWIQRPNEKSVPEQDLAAALSGRVTEKELPRLLGTLQSLGIIRRDNGMVIKRERFILVP